MQNQLPKLPIDRPIGNLEIIDTALELCLNNWKIILTVSLWPALFCFISQVMIQYSINHIILDHLNFMNNLVFAVLALISIVIYFISFWIWFIRQLATARLIAGFSNSIKDSINHINKIQWHIVIYNLAWLITLILFTVLYIITTALLMLQTKNHPDYTNIILGIMIGSIFIVSFCFFIILTLMIAGSIVLICEDYNFKTNLKKIFHFIKLAFLNMIALHIILALLLIPIGIAFYLPSAILSIINITVFERGHQLNELIRNQGISTIIIYKFCEVAFQFFSYSFINITYGLFYLNYKMKFLGFDIIYNLEQNKNLTV